MSSNRKIKVLVVPSDGTGVGAYRSINPHIGLEKYYQDEFHIDINNDPNLNDDEYIKKYDIIHYHRTLGPYESHDRIVDKIEKLGVVPIMDIDDYWSPGKHHPAYLMIKNAKMDEKILNNVKGAKYITTTTELFADEIRKFNKNVFVLPNAINTEDQQFIPKPEKSDRIRIGWLGGSCMTPDTEILTDEGWKRFDELTQNELVATLNPNSNELEYHKPTGYICEPFDGELNCAKNGLIEYEVTPNHNMYASVAKSLTHKNLNLELIQSEKIHNKNFHVKKNANWVGKDEEHFILPMLNEYAEIEENQSYIDNLISKRYSKNLLDKYGSDRRIDMDKWLQFFGFWMADGWTSKTNGLHQVGIAQIKDNDYLNHMYNLLIEMGFNPKYTKDKKQIRVFDKQLWEYLSNFGNAFDKFIPREVLDLSSRQLNIFLEWFIKGDGHIEKNKYTRTRAFTCSPNLANDLQELALKIGVSATITNRGKRTSKINGRTIINQYDSLVVNFSKHPNNSKHHKNTPLVKTDDQYKKYYKGNVYCVEVQNHIIYVRRNGKPMWIGNSHLEDLKLLSGLVSKLKSDKLLDKVQFVLCGFDLRGTMTMIDPKTGQKTQRPIKPKESVWYKYEQIFTDDYKSVSEDYKKFLLDFKKEEYPNVMDEPYRRVWTKPVSTYATNYNLFDISLAPLTDNKFNLMKSQLKVIESGFHKKALIAQDFGPYRIDLINANVRPNKGESTTVFNAEANAYMVSNDSKQWYQFIKRLINNPEQINILGENLYNTVKDTYSIEAVSKHRRDLYLSLLNRK
jgi:glycosyltransferase involved in cell wall biosynthesis